jgi:hypothetical protein
MLYSILIFKTLFLVEFVQVAVPEISFKFNAKAVTEVHHTET